MKCKDIMTTGVQCASPACSIQKAAALMRELNIGLLPVCEAGLRVVGIVTDRDITIRAVAQGFPPSTAVEDLMSHDIVACDPEDELDTARILMAQHHKSRILCLNANGQLEGVISLSDIAQLDETSALETLRHVSSREAHAFGE
jgi:CBS domain-containing protein